MVPKNSPRTSGISLNLSTGNFQPRGSGPLQLDSGVSIEGLIGSRRNIETHRISVVKAAGVV